MKPRKIKFVCNAVRWFDKVNGNTYHSVRITKVSTGETIVGHHPPYQYGYEEAYRQTALETMIDKKWLPVKYRGRHENGYPIYMSYEQENNYPILWNVSDSLKREMIANGTL